QSRMAAIAFIEQRVQEYKIECEFQRVPWHLFTTRDTSSQNDVVGKEKEAAIKAGLSVKEQRPIGLPFELDTVLTLENQAQFNPLICVQLLSASIDEANCKIFGDTQVILVEDGDQCTVHSNSGQVTAEKVIMATHSLKGIYGVHTAMEPYREFALAARIKGRLPAPGVYWHVQTGPQFSIRPYSNESGD